MMHIFKVSDGSWIYSGTKLPSNLATDEYVQGFLPQGEEWDHNYEYTYVNGCLLYTSPSPRDRQKSRMPSSA